jgi:nucleotide-binding universal stress UspA family protein
MFDRILVPFDGSAAAEAALTIAEAIPSRSVRLLAVETEEDELGAVCRGERDCQAYLDRVAVGFRLHGREGEATVEFGDPARRIVASADEADLVIMGSHGRGALGRFLMGSVAEWVAEHSPTPTIIVRGGQQPATALPLTRIVVPLDGSPGAEEALPMAISLAETLGLPLHLVRVVDVDPVRASVVAGGTAARAHLRSSEKAICAARDYLTDVVQTLRNRNLVATCEPRIGPVVGELLAAIRPGDVVVVATPSRGKLERWWLGSVSKELIHRAAGPVMLVRAQGVERSAAKNDTFPVGAERLTTTPPERTP